MTNTLLERPGSAIGIAEPMSGSLIRPYALPEVQQAWQHQRPHDLGDWQRAIAAVRNQPAGAPVEKQPEPTAAEVKRRQFDPRLELSYIKKAVAENSYQAPSVEEAREYGDRLPSTLALLSLIRQANARQSNHRPIHLNDTFRDETTLPPSAMLLWEMSGQLPQVTLPEDNARYVERGAPRAALESKRLIRPAIPAPVVRATHPVTAKATASVPTITTPRAVASRELRGNIPVDIYGPDGNDKLIAGITAVARACAAHEVRSPAPAAAETIPAHTATAADQHPLDRIEQEILQEKIAAAEKRSTLWRRLGAVAGVGLFVEVTAAIATNAYAIRNAADAAVEAIKSYF
jgi:hypothetical protein